MTHWRARRNVPSMHEMLSHDRTKYEINPFPLLLIAGALLWVGIWYGAWLARLL